MAYTRGDYLRQAMTCTATPEGITLRFAARTGRYRPWWKQMRVVVHGWGGQGQVTAARRPVAAHVEATAATLAFTLPDQRRAGDVTIVRR